MAKKLDDYLSLPYTRRCQLHVEDGERYWHCWIVELPGCEVDAPDKAQAFSDLQEVFEDYIKAKLEWGSPISEPSRWPHFLEPSSAPVHPPADVRVVERVPVVREEQDSDAPRTAETSEPVTV